MSTAISIDLNLKLWYAAKDGDKDAVVAAISAGADKNWKNDSEVSDNDHDCSVDSRSHDSSYHIYVQCTVVDT